MHRCQEPAWYRRDTKWNATHIIQRRAIVRHGFIAQTSVRGGAALQHEQSVWQCGRVGGNVHSLAHGEEEWMSFQAGWRQVCCVPRRRWEGVEVCEIFPSEFRVAVESVPGQEYEARDYLCRKTGVYGVSEWRESVSLAVPRTRIAETDNPWASALWAARELDRGRGEGDEGCPTVRRFVGDGGRYVRHSVRVFGRGAYWSLASGALSALFSKHCTRRGWNPLHDKTYVGSHVTFSVNHNRKLSKFVNQ